MGLAEGQAGFSHLETQGNSRAVSEMKTRAFCSFPSLFVSLFTGGRPINDNTVWHSSLVWQFVFQTITPADRHWAPGGSRGLKFWARGAWAQLLEQKLELLLPVTTLKPLAVGAGCSCHTVPGKRRCRTPRGGGNCCHPCGCAWGERGRSERSCQVRQDCSW